MSDDVEIAWAVQVNNDQRTYIVYATDAGTAAMRGGNAWREDETVTPRQRRKGIYDIRARHAKFGEMRQQPTFSVRREEP